MENEFGFVEDAAPVDDGFGFVEDTIDPANDTRIDMDKWLPVPEGKKDLGDQLLAGVSGFGDTVTMGLGNKIAAVGEAVNDKFMDVTGLSPSDKDLTQMYQDRLGKADAAREQLAGQYPTEFEQGEYTGIGTQLFAPSGMTKAAGSGLLKTKAAGDAVVKKGSAIAADATLQNPLIKSIAGEGRMKKVSDVVKQYAPETMADVGTLVTGAGATPGTPIIGAGAALLAKRKAVTAAKNAATKVKNEVGAYKQQAENAARFEKGAADLQRYKKTGSGMSGDAAYINKVEGINKATAASKGEKYVHVDTIADIVETMRKTSREGLAKNKTGRVLTKMSDLKDKYGQFLLDAAARGTDALIANSYIKQQQDPEFRMMLKAVKDEANQE